MSAGSGYLYVLLTPASSSIISVMAVGPDGGLRPLTMVTGLPANAAGLVAR